MGNNFLWKGGMTQDQQEQMNANTKMIKELDNPTLADNIEYRAYILPNGKQVYKKYFSIDYTQQKDIYDYDFTAIPNEYNMVSVEGTIMYKDSGNIYVLNSQVSSGGYFALRRITGKYTFKWYISDTDKTINLSGFVYYTRN